MLKQFALIMFPASVGKSFAKPSPTVPKWVKVGSFRAPCQLICSASVDRAAENGPQTSAKEPPNNVIYIIVLTIFCKKNWVWARNRPKNKCKAKQARRMPPNVR